jgi:tRNA-dihydrouridine synthase B
MQSGLTINEANTLAVKTTVEAAVVEIIKEGEKKGVWDYKKYPTPTQPVEAPEVTEIHAVMSHHLEDLYSFYGIETGLRIARKHISWYTRGLPGSAAFRHAMNQLQDVEDQRFAVHEFFNQQEARGLRLQYEVDAAPNGEAIAA